MDVVNHLVDEDMVVSIEEGLDTELTHGLVHQFLFPDTRGPGSTQNACTDRELQGE